MLLTVVGVACGQHRAASLVSELTEITEIWNTAWLEKDLATVDRLMGPEYVYIAPNGQLLERSKILQILTSPSYGLRSGARSEIDVRRIGDDAAVVINRWRGSGSFEGQEFVDDHRCSISYARESGEWRIVLEHRYISITTTGFSACWRSTSCKRFLLWRSAAGSAGVSPAQSTKSLNIRRLPAPSGPLFGGPLGRGRGGSDPRSLCGCAAQIASAALTRRKVAPAPPTTLLARMSTSSMASMILLAHPKMSRHRDHL